MTSKYAKYRKLELKYIMIIDKELNINMIGC